MDTFDLAILELVQRNNRLTNAFIAESVNLSESAVRRRLARLRKDGVIVADVAIVAAKHQQISVIIEVVFREESAASYRDFKRQMSESPQVSQCFAVSGDIDFIVVAHAESLEAYEQWGYDTLLENPAIARYSTHVVWSVVKQLGVIPPKP